jgi:hypothetical protein
MKLMKYFLLSLFFLPFAFQSCDMLNGALDNVDSLTQAEVIEGLKTALIVGTDTSVTMLGASNGYLNDVLIKILLPENAQNVLNLAMNNNFAKSLGLDVIIAGKIDEVVLRMNRTAEDAVVEAKPIFSNAITGLTLDKAWDILKGINPADARKSTEYDSSAATNYLRAVTFDQLKSLYAPKIDASLSKPLIGGVSTNTAWGALADKYNIVAPYINGVPLDPSLGPYVTDKALNGLFSKIAKAEREIRRDPATWAKNTLENILEKVFGSAQATGGK